MVCGCPARISHQLVPQDRPQGKVCALGYMVFAPPICRECCVNDQPWPGSAPKLFPGLSDIGSDRLLAFVEGPPTFSILLYHRVGR